MSLLAIGTVSSGRTSPGRRLAWAIALQVGGEFTPLEIDPGYVAT